MMKAMVVAVLLVSVVIVAFSQEAEAGVVATNIEDRVSACIPLAWLFMEWIKRRMTFNPGLADGLVPLLIVRSDDPVSWSLQSEFVSNS